MATALQHRELSGAFSDEAKWQDCWNQLASDACPIGTLRIYHNSPQQLIGTTKALLHNSSITQLDIGVVDGPAAAQAIAELVKVNSSIHTFTVQELHAASDAPAAGYTNEPDVPPAQAPPAAAASHSVCPVLQAFACNRSIRCLTLHKLQVGRVLQLAAALANGGCENSLQQLGLPGARLDAAAAGALSAALCKQHQLTNLGLKGTTFSCQHEQQQQQHLKHPTGNSQQAFNSDQGCALGQLFSAALAAHPTLSHVSLQGVACHVSSSSSSSRGGSNCGSSGGSSGGQCWHNLGEYLAATQQLQELALSEAGLSDSDMQQLGCGLAAAAAVNGLAGTDINMSSSSSSNQQAGCSSLKVLDLSGNSMGPEGAKALGRGLGLGCQFLESLKLGGNKMGAEGVMGFVEGLMAAAAAAGAGVECCLQELDLSSNGITDATAVQQLLSHPIGHGLVTLNLSENCLDDNAVQLVAAALSSTISSTVSSGTLSSSTTADTGSTIDSTSSPGSPINSNSSSRVYCCKLSHLNLSHNWIKDRGAKALNALLQYPSSSNLQTLLLNHNRMSRAGVEGLADAAVGNRRVLDLQLQGNRALGRLQALEDLKLVLADRGSKLQQQQQQQQQTSGIVSASNSSRGSPLSSPRDQQHTAAASVSAGVSDDTQGGGGGVSSSTSSIHHWQSPLLSPRSSGSAAALQSPFAAAHMPATAAAAAAVSAEGTTGATTSSSSSSSRARSRTPPAAGYKRAQAELADESAATAAAAGIVQSTDTAVGSSRGPKALATGDHVDASPAAAAAAAAEVGAVARAGDVDADMADAAAHILVGSSNSSSDGDKLGNKALVAAAAAATAAPAPSYLHKAAAIGAATAAAAAVGAADGPANTTVPAAAAAAVAQEVSFQLPSLSGRFLQQQKQQRMGLGLGERSFSFDQWCQDNALQLGAWGSLGDSIGETAITSLGGSAKRPGARGRAASAASIASGKVGVLTRLAAATGAAVGGSRLEVLPEADSLGSPHGQSSLDQQTDCGGDTDVVAGARSCQLLLEEDGSVDGSSSTAAEAAAAAAEPGLLGQAVTFFDGALPTAAAATVGTRTAVAGGLAVQLPAVQGVGRVSSLSGWMTDQAFVQAGRELLLPGVRRKYVFVHGSCDSRDNSSSGSGTGAGVVMGVGVGVGESLVLRPFGSGVLQQQGGLTSFGSGGFQAGGHGSSGSGSGSGNGGSRLSRVVLGSTSRAASGALRLQPKASAASLRLFGSSDGGGSAGSSRSSSTAEDGVWGVGGASGHQIGTNSSSGDGSGPVGMGLSRLGSCKGVLLVRRGWSASAEVGVEGAVQGSEGVPSRLSVVSKTEA